MPRYVASTIPRPGLGYETFDLRYRWPYATARQNRPPRFAHVVVEGGDLRHAIPFDVSSAKKGRLDDALVDRERSTAVRIGTPTWGGRRGVLALAPSFDRSSTIHGDHLVFVWKEGATGYVVSLHVWTPVAETVRTLKAIVASIPRH